jgi:hypothetical protein
MTADIWTIASGATLYAGCVAPPSGVPAWMPASGTMGRVSLNNMNAVFDSANPNTLIRGSAAILNVWNSTTYIPWLDWVIAFGGGHNDYMGNDVYAYKMYDQMWYRISDAVPPGIQLQNSDEITDPIYGELWTDSSKTAVKVGKVTPPHTYCNMVAVPPSAAGNTNGWLVEFATFHRQAHYIDLDTPSVGWQRLGPLSTDTIPTAEPMVYGCSFFDSVRNQIVGFPMVSGVSGYGYALQLPGLTWSRFDASANPVGWINTYYSAGFHAVADDLYLIVKFQMDGSNHHPIYWHDPSNRTQGVIDHTGMQSAGFSTVEWDEQNRQLVAHDSLDTGVWYAPAPLNMKSGTWVWSKRTYAAAQAFLVQSGENYLYKRLHYSASLNADLIVTRVDAAVQLWAR